VLDTFYTTVAQASFTLLALWWVLLQIRHDEWIADQAYRRSIYDVSLYFLLPGMMSLASLLAVQDTSIWRVSFAVFGIVGLAESLWLTGRRGQMPAARGATRVADAVSIVLYALAALVAIWKDLPDEVGIGLTPLELEGLFVAGLLLTGITLAAAIFVGTGPHREETSARPDAT
jgi:hypothetical protein